MPQQEYLLQLERFCNWSYSSWPTVEKLMIGDNILHPVYISDKRLSNLNSYKLNDYY